MNNYLHAPVRSKNMPGGIPYIIGNEAAERFSFYGMRAILVVFMTQYLMGAGNNIDAMNADEAKGWYHLFVSRYTSHQYWVLFYQTACWVSSAPLYCCLLSTPWAISRWHWMIPASVLQSDWGS